MAKSYICEQAAREEKVSQTMRRARYIYLALILLSAFLALPAHATTYNVSTTLGLATALNTAVAGDDIQIADGTYTDPSLLGGPTYNGPKNSGTAASRIRIIGNTANNSKVILYGTNTTSTDQGNGASYITWHSLTFQNNFVIGWESRFSNSGPVGDSVVQCRMLKSLGLANGSNCVFNTDTIGSNANDAKWSLKNGIYSTSHLNDNVFVDCVGYLRNTNSDDDNCFGIHVADGWLSNTSYRNSFIRCKVNMTGTGTTVKNWYPMKMYYVNGLTLTDCRFTVTDSNTTPSPYATIAYLWRDASINWTCLRDTFEVLPGPGITSAQRVRFDVSSPGNNGPSTGHRKFTNCVFRNTGIAYDNRAAFDWNNGICADTLSHCQFLSSDPTAACVGLFDIRAEPNPQFSGRMEGTSFFDHCTFIGGIGESYANTAQTGMLQINHSSIIPDNADLWIRNSIFLAVDSTGGNPYVGWQKAGIYVDMVGGFAAHYHRDWNLYAYKGKTTTLGERAIQYRINGSPARVPSQPQTNPAPWSAAGTASTWYSTTRDLPSSAGGLDGNSKWGYAMFNSGDSTAAGTDGIIAATSAAANADEFGKDMGAIPRSVDTTAPSALSTLAAGVISTNSITVTFTSVGDDAGTGTAASYQIRYSTSVITSANFAAATNFVSPISPSVAGTAQSIKVTGLTAGTEYYIAIKAVDEVGNAGTISNVVFQQTNTGGGHLLKIPN